MLLSHPSVPAVSFSYFSAAEMANFSLAFPGSPPADETSVTRPEAFCVHTQPSQGAEAISATALDSFCPLPPVLGFCPASYPLLNVLQPLTIHGLLSISLKSGVPHLLETKPNLPECMSASGDDSHPLPAQFLTFAACIQGSLFMLLQNNFCPPANSDLG